MRDRQYFKDLLSRQEAVVTFVKKDKSLRDMHCTLQASKVPKTLGGVASAESNPDNVVVFDLEKKSWRCFNTKNVINVEEV